LIASASSTALAQASSGPTSGQIAAAVRKAERSRDLWATVNECKVGRTLLTIGIRGQMPALGFSATMVMTIQAEYLSGQQLKPIKKAVVVFTADSVAQGLQQNGEYWTFILPYNGVLSGEITFTWKLGGKVLSKVTRQTTGGHPDAAHAQPRHFSAARCQG
jgi:hypothetical protein